MPTKFTGRKDRKTEEKHKLKKNSLMNKTPEEIDRYIDKNVKDIKSAKKVLKLLARIAIFKS